jgi:superfamily II DNA/RNA helicase
MQHEQFDEMLARVLNGEPVDIPLTRHNATDYTPIEGVLRRLQLALQQEAFLDATVSLRQLLRMRGEFVIPTSVYNRLVRYFENSHISSERIIQGYRLTATNWRPDWLKSAVNIDIVEKRRKDTLYLGDGMLYAMSQWDKYLSEAQKVAVDTWLFAPDGTTTLVTLPTGSGKSILTLLPSWLESDGGMGAGATLVIVPTVALALDQERQARQFFKGAAKPQSQTGNTSRDEREQILADLKSGKLPVLYTSPESLLQSRLYETCLEATRRGLIKRLVIDEAHLVESWGAHFRTEFQLLPAYRRQLLRASRGKLKTLLLSATVTDETERTLKKLFSDDGKWIQVEANRLRPEVGFWVASVTGESARLKRVLEALYHLPRPAIVYTTKPDDAVRIEKALKNEGYRRVRSFTGETASQERHELNRLWNENQLDIMVATSAFGLGVDKPDVRTILHATIPENIDRFYQEVGRAGRDGWSAISVVCPDYDDKDNAEFLNPKRIGEDKGRKRWLEMLKRANPHPERQDIWVLDYNVRHGGLAGKYDSEANRNWNLHLILLLQRAGVLVVEDIVKPTYDESGNMQNTEVLVRAVNEDLARLFDVHDTTLFDETLQKVRASELQASRENFERFLKMLTTFAPGGEPTRCIAHEFSQNYSNVTKACGGCAYCRREGQEPYGSERLDFQIDYPKKLRQARRDDTSHDVDEKLLRLLKGYDSILVTWSGKHPRDVEDDYLALMPRLLRSGFRQMIVPNTLAERMAQGAYVAELAQPRDGKRLNAHRLVPTDWLVKHRIPAYPLPTAIFYDLAPDGKEANAQFEALFKNGTQDAGLPLVLHFIPLGLVLRQAGKAFTDHVNGLTVPLDDFLRLLEEVQEPLDLF